MTAKQSVIKCPKCGYLPNMLGDTCLKCNTALEKVCGGCSFANPVDKNYCAHCGAVLTLQPPPRNENATPPPGPSQAGPKPGSFILEMESIQDTVSERATSFRLKPPEAQKPAIAAPPKPAAPPPPPQPAPGLPVPPKPAAVPQQHEKPPTATSVLTPDSFRLPGQAGLPKSLQPSLIKKILGPAITLLLVSVLLGILYMIVSPSLPRLRLVMTAKSYLTYISEHKFEKAYELLSSNSKAGCTEDDYIKNSKDYYAKVPAWQFKDVEVFTLDKNAAMIRYQLKDGDQPWKSDYISFVRENNRWARPYIWVLFHPIEEALKQQDFPHALFLAQKLYLTDPIDPRTSGYLCVSEFFMGLYEKSAESCKRTLEAAVSYPVGYSREELFWFNSHYADSLRYLQRDRAALAEYDKLFKWPGLASAELCTLYLNSADSTVNLKDYERALHDIMKAEGLCVVSPAKEDARKRLGYMSGSAGKEAIAFAQKSRLQPGMPTLE
ncbi:MAG: hypothetical protein Q8O90_09670, partial [Elusimicrobiota bacterium]|nr:hypothetical protein [Elusimicrobiota bacterium]